MFRIGKAVAIDGLLDDCFSFPERKYNEKQIEGHYICIYIYIHVCMLRIISLLFVANKKK